MIKTFQIWRKPQESYNEPQGQDIYVGFRRTREEAEKWIETQKDQNISPSEYYIKQIGAK